MTEKEQALNTFLVVVFNDVLRMEEEALRKGDFKNLSVSEMHVIEAVCNAEKDETNTMAQLASKIQVSASTLTIAVKTLEQKGYLQRTRATDDRRRVLVTATALALRANQNHSDFHYNMVKHVAQQLTDFEMQTLNLALSNLHQYFKNV